MDERNKDKEIPQYYLECLKKDVETKVGRSIDTSSDFNFLYLELKKVCPDTPSVSTLKRLWAYVPDKSRRSRGTLNSLARFLGFADWTSYLVSLMRDNRVESGYLNAKTLISSSILKGDLVEVSWNPDRLIRLVSLGNNRFEVVESENSKLNPGMTLTALMFSMGLPLMCINVMEGGNTYDSYVAGSRSGITSLKFIPGKDVDDVASRQID